MIRRRFQTRRSRRLLDLKGHFTLIHTGGGTFVYAIPGRHHPIVGKIELGRKKYRSQGLRFLAFSGLLLGAMSVLSNVVATSISKGPDLNASLTPQELEQRSEELRARLLRGEAQNESKVPIIEHVVQNGETLQKLAIQYRIPAQMISVSS
ncbi:MAG: hypothetical protein HY042_02390, partial [Spirochaetia bacterium]|nr:hypothetical protein [Spirochaetia bacterium]